MCVCVRTCMKQKGVNVKGGLRNGMEYGMANFAVESQGFVVLATTSTMLGYYW